jgi:ribonucleoside-triphosphate reductase
LTNDFDWDSEIAELLFKVTARFGIPYFQNYIGSNLDPDSIRAMCCRLNLNLDELTNQPGSLWGKGDSTGSIGVVTINLNRLAYLAKKAAGEEPGSELEDKAAEEKYLKLLDKYMEMAKESLEKKRMEVTKNMNDGLMPYSKAYLGSFRNYFSTIGLCGGNEACLNLLGKSIADKEGKKFISEVLKRMRDNLIDFQENTGHLYNLEATPAESTAYRFALLDKEYCPGVITAGMKDSPYLTNSTQLPVDYTDDPMEALLHQSEIQPLYSGGTVFHTFLGEEIDWKAAKNMVKKIAENTQLPYFTLTPTFSICHQHGRIKGEVYKCPECGKPTEVYSRVVGYFRAVSLWNNGKKQEFKERRTFGVE